MAEGHEHHGHQEESQERPEKRSEQRPSRDRRPRERMPGIRSVLRGAQQVVELTGKDLEGIIGVARDGDHWTVRLEMLELRRIPSTTDVLAVYEVDLDEAANLIGYRRLERYVRGSPSEDRS